MHELETTLNAMPADLVLSATPIDLTRVLKLEKPVVRVRYELEEMTAEPGQAAQPKLADLLRGIVEKARAGSTPAAHR
jgi:predicted GTPase